MEDREKAAREFKKVQEKCNQAVNADLEKLSKLKTEDFQCGIVDHLRATHESITNNDEAIFSLLEFSADQRDKILNGVREKNIQIEQDITSIFKRLCTVEGYLYCFIIKFMGKIDRNLSFEAMQKVESDLSMDFDGIHGFCFSIGDGNGKDKVQRYIRQFQKEAPEIESVGETAQRLSE